MSCLICDNDNTIGSQFCTKCGTSLSASTTSHVLVIKDNSIRYHGIDALRGIAMLLGIVLHAAIPYMPNIEEFWPTDENSSHIINTIFHFIHIWRMPLFFILTGFFANLIISKKSWKSWWKNRLLRIVLPVIVFSPLMSLTLPWIFNYGRIGEFIFFYTDEGQPFHLWFLWHLIIFVIVTAIFRPMYLLGIRSLDSLNTMGLGVVSSVFYKSKSILSVIIFRSKFPIVFITFCCFINLPMQGDIILNPIASGLYFTIGYSLFRNESLFMFLKTYWRYYFLAGLICFILFMILESRNPANIYSVNLNDKQHISTILEPFTFIKVFIEVTCAILFSYAFIGLAEKRFGSYNTKKRFISDGAYWMYLIHLPIVTLITFSMFNLGIPIEIKFLISILITSMICLVTYKYFVRSTPIGILLNGKRHTFKIRKL